MKTLPQKWQITGGQPQFSQVRVQNPQQLVNVQQGQLASQQPGGVAGPAVAQYPMANTQQIQNRSQVTASPAGPQTVPTPSTFGSIQSPASVYNPGSVGASVASPAPMNPADEQVYLEKLKQLSVYIPPLQRMINKLAKEEHGKSEQCIKLTILLDILTNPSKRVKLATLSKVEAVLNKVIHIPPSSTSSSVATEPQPQVPAYSQNFSDNHVQMLSSTHSSVQLIPPLPPSKRVRLQENEKKSPLPHALQGGPHQRDANALSRKRTLSATTQSRSQAQVFPELKIKREDPDKLQETRNTAACSSTGNENAIRSFLHQAFECKICLGVAQLPAAACRKCKNIIGCITCVENWYARRRPGMCPICREEGEYALVPVIREIQQLLKSFKSEKDEE